MKRIIAAIAAGLMLAGGVGTAVASDANAANSVKANSVKVVGLANSV